MATRFVSPETIAQARAMFRSGMTKKRIANQLGLSRDTVKRYVAGDLPKHADVETMAQSDEKVTRTIADRFDAFLLKATDLMQTDEFVARMGEKPWDLARGVAIVTERRELLGGRATGRNVTVLVSLARPGALKELASGVIEGDYRTLPAHSEGAAPEDGAVSDS